MTIPSCHIFWANVIPPALSFVGLFKNGNILFQKMLRFFIALCPRDAKYLMIQPFSVWDLLKGHNYLHKAATNGRRFV